VKKSSRRIIIVSNRLPIICEKQDHGEWNIIPSSGGLVAALDPIFKNQGGIWIGWPGTTDAKISELKKPLDRVAKDYGYRFVPVSLTEKARDDFYLGFSNEVLWPLFHDLQTRCHFAPRYFQAYQKVNTKFAWVIAKQSKPGDLLWIHDYHLMSVAEELRKIGITSRMAFFLHIPFPSLDIFLKLPWRSQIMKSLLEFDLLGFQTNRDLRNFLDCTRHLGYGRVHPKTKPSPALQKIRVGAYKVSTGSFPISIDYEAFASESAKFEILSKSIKLREDLPNRELIIGVDRLDYTKGIPNKLEAFRNALQRYPELRSKVTLVQIVVPSREDITEYHDLKRQVEQLVGEINGQFTKSGWVPIHYIFQHMDRTKLLAFYRMCRIAMVTPTKDGMNLVAKEYCASNVDDDGVTLLRSSGYRWRALRKASNLLGMPLV